MTVASFINPTTVVYVGPRDTTLSYEWQIAASGGSVTDHQFVGPVDGGAGHGVVWLVSSTPSGDASRPIISVFGTWDGPSLAPSARDWFTVRADTVTGANVYIAPSVGVNSIGPIKILTPARSYRMRVSAAANTTVSSAIKVRAFVYSGQNW